MRDSKIFSLAFIIVGLSLWTLAPYGGCSCNNPMGPNSGPAATPTPDHGPKVDNMEHLATANLNDNFGGVVATTADNLPVGSEPVAGPPSTPVPQLHHEHGQYPWPRPQAATFPEGSPGYAAYAYGFIGHDNPPYPYAQLIFNLNTPANVPFYALNKSLKFSLQSRSDQRVNEQFFVNFTDSVITDFWLVPLPVLRIDH